MGRTKRQKTKPKKSAVKARGGAVSKCPKNQLKSGEIDTYGALLKKKGDGKVHRDHIPSHKAAEKRAQKLLKRKLTKAEKEKVKKAMPAVTLPDKVHKQGRTYGGKNTDSQTTADAKDLAAAAKQDVKAYQPVIGKSDPKLMSKVEEMSGTTNAEYDKMILDALK